MSAYWLSETVDAIGEALPGALRLWPAIPPAVFALCFALGCLR